MWKSTGPQKGKPDGMGLRKGAILQPARPGRAFKGLGGAKRYCRKDSIGDRFVHRHLFLALVHCRFIRIVASFL